MRSPRRVRVRGSVRRCVFVSFESLLHLQHVVRTLLDRPRRRQKSPCKLTICAGRRVKLGTGARKATFPGLNVPARGLLGWGQDNSRTHMNTILATSKKVLTGRILAIEPDPMRSRNLRELLEAHVDGRVEVVASTEGAIRCIGRQLPDVMLTSSFLPPSDEAALTEHLKSLPAAAHVQVIITPHFIDSEETARPSRSPMFGLRGRRPSQVRPACDPATFIRQIEDYIQQARTHAQRPGAPHGTRHCARALDRVRQSRDVAREGGTRRCRGDRTDAKAVDDPTRSRERA